MKNAVAGFEWDAGNREKCQKHGVSLAEIEYVLEQSPGYAPDPRHSSKEDRFIAVGRTSVGRPVFIAVTFRDTDAGTLIRPISARYMHQKEIESYEKAGP